MDFLCRHNFTFENFAQENGKKISKHAYKVGKNGQKVRKMNKIMNFQLAHTNFQKIAQSQYFFIFFLDKSCNLFKFESVLSASVERVGVSRMRDFINRLLDLACTHYIVDRSE